MKRLTGGLIVAAVALGALAVRNARRALRQQEDEVTLAPAPQPAAGARPPRDDSMVIRRNEPLDNGIAVHSPFDGDRGIVRQAPANGQG